jgi:hypothetical protein
LVRKVLGGVSAFKNEKGHGRGLDRDGFGGVEEKRVDGKKKNASARRESAGEAYTP